MDAAEVREWCLKAVTKLNVVESELTLGLDHDLILNRLAPVKEMVAELLDKAHQEAPAIGGATMRVELKPSLHLQAKRSLTGKEEAGLRAVTDRFTELLTAQYDLAPSQSGALRRYLVFNFELYVSNELNESRAICARLHQKQGPMPAWPSELEDALNLADLERDVYLTRAPDLEIELVSAGEYYLDLHKPGEPKAATFEEALTKADDCEKHAQDIRRACGHPLVEDVLRVHLERIHYHTIWGPYEKVLEHTREALALLDELGGKDE